MTASATDRGRSRDRGATMVGRDPELAWLRRRMDAAARGAGGMVLVQGAPGVGKSALLGAVGVDAVARGWLVLGGRGLAAERGLGYAPIVEAFGPDLERLGVRRAAALVQGLPQLGRLFGGVPGRGEPIGDPAVERIRLVDAIARLCERVTAATPLMLALDDLQWADPATLELVHHLVRRLEGDRFLLLAAARAEAVAPQYGPEFAGFLDSARRLRLVDERALAPLAPDDVVALLGELLPGAAPSSGLAAFVHRRSGGVPLFVGALARSLADDGALTVLDGEWTIAGEGAAAGVPAELRPVLADRLARLDPADRAVLDVLAVHAAPLAHPVLAAACGLDDRDLAAVLARLAAAGVVVEEETGGTVTLAVAHGLLGDAATAMLPATARQRLHLRLADAVERGTPAALDALARHLRGAGALVTADRVVPALWAAAELATRRGDHAAAADALGEVVERLRADP
ncbi:MAG: AAA family ATPase, partial [Pseudonocardia sp.]|nr:AAA family ATPase [Pseudonocardia sp.]